MNERMIIWAGVSALAIWMGHETRRLQTVTDNAAKIAYNQNPPIYPPGCADEVTEIWTAEHDLLIGWKEKVVCGRNPRLYEVKIRRTEGSKEIRVIQVYR